MARASVKDRRSSPRHPFESAVRIRVINASGKAVELEDARVENVGLGGVFIRTSTPLAYGTFTDFSFTFPRQKSATHLQGLVRWRKDREGVGIEFFYASREERDRIEKVLSRLRRIRRAERE